MDAYEPDENNAELPDNDALLLQTLHERLTAIRPPLSARLDDIVDLFSALKNAEYSLRAVLIYHPQAAGLMRLERSLSVFVKQRACFSSYRLLQRSSAHFALTAIMH